MSRIALFLSAWMLYALAAVTAPAQSSTTPDRSSDQYRAGQPGMMSQSSSTVGEDPKGCFEAARDAFNSKNYDVASKNLREAADILRRDAGMTKGMAANALKDSARDLDKLADRIQRGEVRTVDDLNDRIGQSYKSLSNFHYEMARESYNRNRAAGASGRDVETGNYLNAAANDLESWAAFTGQTIKSGTQTTISETKELAGKLIAGTGKITEKTGLALDNLGTAIKDYGRGIMNRSNKQAPETTAPGTPPGKAPGTAPGTRY